MKLLNHFKTIFLVLLGGLSVLFASISQVAAQQTADRDIYIPTTISKEAQQALKALIKVNPYTPAFSAPGDLETWRKTHGAAEQAGKEKNDKAVERNRVTLTETKLGGVSYHYFTDFEPKVIDRIVYSRGEELRNLKGAALCRC